VSGFAVRLTAVAILLGLALSATLGPPKPTLTHVSSWRLR